MISIVYEERRHSLTARGHANHGAAGQDIVCAAASALICALIGGLQEQEAAGECRLEQLHFSKGAADVAAEGDVEPAFAMILGGLRQLARRYPECVSVEEI